MRVEILGQERRRRWGASSLSIRQLHSIMTVQSPREFPTDPSRLTQGDKWPNSKKIAEP